MTRRRKQSGRYGLYVFISIWFFILLPFSVAAAPYAAMVMDARSGKILHAENADTRLHPASLTKMMTLYIVFEAVQNGEITMDTEVRISKKAASEPPSRLGLRAGQKIKLRYLVRAAAIKSANDASTAIAEAISGSEAAFARRMNRMAQAMGMTRTTFRNAHGLTQQGHLSTARDMTILGRHVIYDYPQYYNLFSRRTDDAGVRRVSHTNSRLLENYRGADGIKTGYTRAAGFNLVASAERGNERVIATVFGGRSTTTRNARVAELLNLGFRKAPTRVAFAKPNRPPYRGRDGITVEKRTPDAKPGRAGKVVRAVPAAVKRSLRPVARPGTGTGLLPQNALIAAAIEDNLKAVLADAQTAEPDPPADLPATPIVTASSTAAPLRSLKPAMRPSALVTANTGNQLRQPEPEREIVTRVSTSGGRHWGITVGNYPNKFQAEKALMKTALIEMETLEGSLRKVVGRSGGFDARFLGLTRETADLACRRLMARQLSCFMLGPD